MRWRERLIVHTVDEVEQWLRQAISLDKGLLVGMDGFDGAGKSHLTRALSERCNVSYIEVDERRFRARHFDDDSNVTSYVETTSIPGLKEDVSRLRAGAVPFVVDAVTLDDVLTAVGEKADVRIYVMKLDENYPDGELFWLGQHHIAAFEEGRSIEPSPLTRCILEYHVRTKPHEHADLIYARRPRTDC